MEITHVYTDTSGESHFEMIPMIMDEATEKGFVSKELQHVDQVLFRNTFGGETSDPILVSHKVYVAVLQGTFDVQVSSGEEKSFGPGDVILFNDKSGKGHTAKTGDSTVYALVIRTND